MLIKNILHKNLVWMNKKKKKKIKNHISNTDSLIFKQW
jgi:hypothetical protein